MKNKMFLTRNIMPLCILVIFVFFVQLARVEADCTLSLNNDFAQPSPVFLQDGHYLKIDSNAVVTVKRSDILMVACPGEKRKIFLNNVTSGLSEVEAHCIHNNTFRVNRWTGPFKGIRCNTQPWFSAEETGASCYEGHKMYKIGYKVHNAFYPLYEACFNKNLMSTIYVVHEVSPRSKTIQGGQRPQFIEGDLFGKVRMSNLYKSKSQIDRVDRVLGEGYGAQFITNKQFLNRGHLAPRADFPMRAEQRASFHYVNTAPQWMRGNAGDWAALEEALRRRIRSLGHPVTVYTGTHGVMTIANDAGAAKEFYLDADANNNNIVPVPMYFFKVVYDPKTKKAAAFISINSSFYSDSQIRALTFCDDVCDGDPKFSWLRWRSNDGTFSFCCEYQDFVGTVKSLPPLDVDGLFY